MTATLVYNSDRFLRTQDTIFQNTFVPLYVKAWKFFKAAVIGNKEFYKLVVRPWWNQSKPGDLEKVFIVIDHEDPSKRCSWCRERSQCLELLFYLDCLWREYRKLLSKGYEIMLDFNIGNTYHDIALVLRNNKLFTEIRYDIRGGIFQHRNLNETIIFGFAECCVHSITEPLFQIGLSERYYPEDDILTYTVPRYIIGVNWPFALRHPHDYFRGLVLKAIVAERSLDIHGSHFDSEKYKRLRIRKDNFIFIDKSKIYL